MGTDASSSEPAVITADELVFDQNTNLVTARGNVEISQGARILRADEVTYNRETQVVTATGSVVLAEPNGDVYFSDRAEITDDLKNGFVERVAVLMADNSRLAGSTATRQNGEITIVNDAVYSPCQACEDDPNGPLLWQIRAEKVTHDSVAHDIIYNDATLEFFGVPVFYTPYFRHPDPTVERRSGFLPPTFGTSTVLGGFFTAQYYQDIAPNQDATFMATVTGEAGVVLGGEYRYRFDNALISIEGSINRSNLELENVGTDVTDLATGEGGDAWRGHVFANALFNWDEHWRSGAEIRWTSDDDYLETFHYDSDDVLQSRVYTEGFYGLSYISVEALAFQDLRDSKGTSPTVGPWINGNYMGEPGDAPLGGQWFVNASLLNLWRDGTPTESRPTAGLDTTRFSVQAGWQRELYTDFGLVVTGRASVRGDFYWSDQLPDPEPEGSELTRDDVQSARFYPVGTLIARYPFVGPLDTPWGMYQQLIEPVVGITVAPTVDPETDIPNNDSADPEFDDINLFSDNRFPGLDRVEGGQRITYGIRYGIFGSDGTSSTIFLGQSHRFQVDPSFSQSSGLYDEWSDIVGRVTLNPAPWVSVDWRFRLDNEDLEARRQSVVATVGPSWLKLNASYSYLSVEGNDDLLTDQEQIRLGFNAQLDRYWSAAGSISYDIADENLYGYRAGLRYADECFIFGVSVERRYSTNEELNGEVTAYVTIGLKNLSSFSTDPAFGGVGTYLPTETNPPRQ